MRGSKEDVCMHVGWDNEVVGEAVTGEREREAGEQGTDMFLHKCRCYFRGTPQIGSSRITWELDRNTDLASIPPTKSEFAL